MPLIFHGCLGLTVDIFKMGSSVSCSISIAYMFVIYTLFQNAAILVFFCFHANWSLWPSSRLDILLNFTFESEAIRAYLHGNKRILKLWPFWNKVYYPLNFHI